MSFYLLCIYHVLGTMIYIMVNPGAILDTFALTEATSNKVGTIQETIQLNADLRRQDNFSPNKNSVIPLLLYEAHNLFSLAYIV